MKLSQQKRQIVKILAAKTFLLGLNTNLVLQQQ